MLLTKRVCMMFDNSHTVELVNVTYCTNTGRFFSNINVLVHSKLGIEIN